MVSGRRLGSSSPFLFGQQDAGFGNILTDPVVPTLSGGTVLKFLLFAGIALYVFRKIGK